MSAHAAMLTAECVSPYNEPDVVDVYDRVSAPLQFAAPARDLVDALRLKIGERVLDVGTGTGVAALAAAGAVGSSGKVVGVDPSLLMLGRAWLRGTVCLAAGRAPGLPFSEGCFDAVMANFVLSHLPDPGAGLANMTQVLRPGGRLGVSAWGAGITVASELWKELVTLFTDSAQVKQAFDRVIPSDARISDAAHLDAALRGAGLRDIQLLRRRYLVTMSVADYLAMKQSSVEGTLIRRQLTSLEWTIFTRQLAARFQARFGDAVRYRRDAHIAIGAVAG